MKTKLLRITAMVALMLATMIMGQAQNNVPITLEQGWNWIGYPYAESADLETALGDFEPMPNDLIKSYYDLSTYYEGYGWYGDVNELKPGWGYMYYSNRTTTVIVVLHAPTSSSMVTTAEPTEITTTSAIVGGTVTLPEGSHVFLRGVCWGTTPNPDIDGDHTSEEPGVGVFNSTLEGLTPGTTYYVRAYAVTDFGLDYGEEQSFTTLVEYAYVDLGLPSGTLWATCNVGANSPEEYGDYFAWGETQPKDNYDWSTYQYCMGSNNTLTKYCSVSDFGYNGFTDALTILLPEDDAATANWGTDWRMPTKEEWQELYENTYCSWTQENEVNGWRFTASNGNSIFLPAAGYRNGDGLFNAGSRGDYKSSSLNTDVPNYAWYLYFNSDYCGAYSRMRDFGQSVRPVRSSAQNNAPTGAINGKFTINDNGDQVYFSQGNLQYIGSATTPYWKFANNQWDVLGTTTGQNGTSQNVDRDLFGWGTSGYNHGAICYQPWSTSQANSDYYAYGQYTNNLNDQNGQADWGYNPISNGGNQENQWRTLKKEEWTYLIDTRTTISGIRYAKANVNSVNGVILLPDEWSVSTYSLSNTNNSSANFSSNTLTASQWSVMEQAGAVFLPAAGCRVGTSVNYVGSDGYYWMASYYNSTDAYNVYFYDSTLYPQFKYRRIFGYSVRLVCVAE